MRRELIRKKFTCGIKLFDDLKEVGKQFALYEEVTVVFRDNTGSNFFDHLFYSYGNS